MLTKNLTKKFPKVDLAHLPTPLEFLPNLTRHLNGPKLWMKRDDATGLAMGGNKARQLEYYVGRAKADGCDALLTTGATQSNHVRQTVAAARKVGMYIEVQLEHRVAGRPSEYDNSGNPFLNKLMGAKVNHYHADGDDEDGADQAIYDRAEELKAEGYNPCVIPLGSMDNAPWGALGYVEGMEEILLQTTATGLNIDAIIIPSGSANTQSGILAGIIALGLDIPVYGFCVRRDTITQHERVLVKTRQVLKLLDLDENAVTSEMVKCEDWVLSPGYGQLNESVEEAIAMTAREEGILLDPAYTGKSMAGLIEMIRKGVFTKDQNVLYIHTGGTPALFGYPELVAD